MVRQAGSDVLLTLARTPGRDVALGACPQPNSADSRTFSSPMIFMDRLIKPDPETGSRLMQVAGM